MSFKSCDPGIVFEVGLSESSGRECLRSVVLFVCEEEMGTGEGIYCFSSSQVAGFFGMIEERNDEIHLKVA